MKSKGRKTIRRIVTLLLVAAMVLGLSGIGSLKEVNAAGYTMTIKASQITGNSLNLVAEQLKNANVTAIVLDMDKDIQINQLTIPDTDGLTKSFTIKGNHILNVVEKGDASGIMNINASMKVESGAKLKLGTTGNAGVTIICYGDFTSYGEVTFYGGYGLAVEGGNINICGGSFSAFDTQIGFETYGKSVNISGGKVRIVSSNPAINGVEKGANVNISGGDLYLEAKWPAIYCEGAINITGGEIEAVVTPGIANYSSIPAIVGKSLSISNDLIIRKPDDGIVTDFVWSETDTEVFKAVSDPMGVIAQHVVINKPDDADNPGGTVPGGNGEGAVHKNEWVNGKWYDANGKQSYGETLSWKNDGSGWYVQDTAGWYPQSQWQKIDGKWYYFTAEGYMDYSEYRDGCWLGADGAWDEAYSGGRWDSDSYGWWYVDASGWYPQSKWVWIDGSCYYFGGDGYMLTNQYVDGCWVGADGAWS